MCCPSIFNGHTDNRTHRPTQLLLDNHQLSNCNFNILHKCIVIYFYWTHGQPDKQTNITLDNHQLSNSNFNILLKCIVYLLLFDTQTTRHTDQHNFYWITTRCPILTSILFSNVLSIYFHWTHEQLDTQTKTNSNGHTHQFCRISGKCIDSF